MIHLGIMLLMLFLQPISMLRLSIFRGCNIDEFLCLSSKAFLVRLKMIETA